MAESMIKITYDGTDYWLDDDQDGKRTVKKIGDALKMGDVVWIDHRNGRTGIAVSPGTVVTIDAIAPIEALGIS